MVEWITWVLGWPSLFWQRLMRAFRVTMRGPWQRAVANLSKDGEAVGTASSLQGWIESAAGKELIQA